MNTVQADAKAIFLEALEIAAPRDRADFLDVACAGHAELRARVDELLAADSGAGGFLRGGSRDATEPLELLAERPGMVIGPYKLLEQIGEGGFGVVFLAEQERPVKRRVALKVIKPGMDTREVIARFEAERQALALMDHPNIAKVLDAGTTGEGARDWGLGTREEAASAPAPSPEPPVSSPHAGRPYFVMELVQGVPITEYCDKCHLTTRERLELFVTVCQAVQHAHQKGIIHRDLKPTNVLVAVQDGRAAPKIIDFGVAKAIGEQSLAERTLTTAFAQMVGTPLYMSPEQAELSPLGVDTRSDIYSLGVLLYELLTGATPFDKDRLHEASYDELRRIIREEEPPRPSARISTLAADLATTVAEHRRTDARRLCQQVHGELDWIVMKCLEKDRNRRYDSAGSLARDVERYLADEPVQACPPSTVYRLRKYARRNKAVLAFVALLVAGIVFQAFSNLATKWERDAKTTALAQATTESAKARAISDLLQGMLRSANPDEAKDAAYTVRQLLDDFSASFGEGLPDQREVEAEIRATIGRAYWRLGATDKAEPHLTKALDLRRGLFGPDHEKFAESLVDIAWCRREQGRLSEAEAAARDAQRIYRDRGAVGSPAFKARVVLQLVLSSTGRFDEAQKVTDEALALARASGGEYPEIADILHNRASIYIEQNRFSEAVQAARQAVDMHRRLHEPGHPETAWGLYTLGNALQKQQKLAEAEDAFREALTIFGQRYRGEHDSLTNTLGSLKQVLTARGDQSGLEALAREEAKPSETPDDDLRVAELLTTSKPMGEQRREDARRLIRRAMAAYERVAVDYPGDLDRRARALDRYAVALGPCVAAPGFAAEIDELNRRLKAEVPKLLAAFPNSGDCQWWAGMVYRGWAFELFMHTEHLPTAEYAFSESIEIYEKLSKSDPKRLRVGPFLASTYAFLGDTQWRAGKLDDANVSFHMALDIFDQHAAEIAAEPWDQVNFEVTYNYVCIAPFLIATQQEQEAAELLRRAKLNAKRITDPVRSVTVLSLLASAQLQLGDQAGYRASCQSLLGLPFDNLDDICKSRLIAALCLAPQATDDLDLLVKRAKDFAVNNELDARHDDLLLLGAALFRAGQYERAAEQLADSVVAYASAPPPDHVRIHFSRLLLAMTEWKRGRQDDARRLLAETLSAVDKEIQNPATHFDIRAVLEILRPEAEALIQPNEVDEVPNADNPTPNVPLTPDS